MYVYTFYCISLHCIVLYCVLLYSISLCYIALYLTELHPMDCTDIVIGSERNGFTRIGDYYTRDRSTPVHDEYFGGSSDLTAGAVFQDGDETVMVFRKKMLCELITMELV